MIQYLVGDDIRRDVAIKKARTQLGDYQHYDRRSEPDARFLKEHFQELLLTYQARPSSLNRARAEIGPYEFLLPGEP